MQRREIALKWTRRTWMSGFSLLELIVVIGVVGLLLAILIPAVQSARESARQTQCANNLRQIGIGLLAYEESRGYFPPSATEGKAAGELGNWIIRVMPHMGQAVFHAHYKTLIDELYRNGRPGIEEEQRFMDEMGRLVPPGFLCPSDGAFPECRISYPGNAGIWPIQYGHNGIFRIEGNTSIGYVDTPVRAAEITDGLTNTMMVCEWLSAPYRATSETTDTSKRWIWLVPLQLGSGADVETLIQACEQVPPGNPHRYGWQSNGGLGRNWYMAAGGICTYFHAMTPNKASCQAFQGIGQESGLYTAGSVHSRGVNGLYADGRVGFVNDSVDQQVWQDLGSISPVVQLSRF